MLISVTSLLAGRVGDIYGRRMTLLSGALIFTIGGLIQVNFLPEPYINRSEPLIWSSHYTITPEIDVHKWVRDNGNREVDLRLWRRVFIYDCTSLSI
jgi:hypothetical protein